MDALTLARAIWEDRWFAVILALLILNVASGIAASAYLKTFALGGLADFLMTRAFPYVLVDGALQLVIRLALGDDAASAAGIDDVLGTVVHGFVVLSLAGKIFENLRSMGFPIPRVLADTPKMSAKAGP